MDDDFITYKFPPEKEKEMDECVERCKALSEPIVVHGVYLCDLDGLSYEAYMAACKENPCTAIEKLFDSRDKDTAKALEKLFGEGILTRDSLTGDITRYLFKKEQAIIDDASKFDYNLLFTIRKVRMDEEHTKWKNEVKKNKSLNDMYLESLK